MVHSVQISGTLCGGLCVVLLRAETEFAVHLQMRELLSRRVQDGVINRLIGKWLKAGVWEKGEVSCPKEGTPQGGLNEINTEKTRLVRFGRPPRAGGRCGDKPESFDFLGFTHYWRMSQKGNPVVMKKTAKGRFRRMLQAIKEWRMGNRHLSMKEQ